MAVSAYLKATFFVVAAAAALFAAAGTVVIPGFWAYLAIFAVVMIVSFAALDPDLLRERMRPGGKKPPLALTVYGCRRMSVRGGRSIEAPRVHHAARRRSNGLAARGAGAAAEDAGSRLSVQRVG